MNVATDSLGLRAADPSIVMAADSALVGTGVAPDTSATVAGTRQAETTGAVPPEQIGMWTLLGVLYPLMLLVGVRLLRIGMRRARDRAQEYLDRWREWMLASGMAAERARLLRRSGDLALRLVELGVYLLCIYGFSLYFFLLIPGTRSLGFDMASQIWPPLRAAVALALQTASYLAFAAAVLLAARWATPRLRVRLFAGAVRPATPAERERMLALRSAGGLVRFVAVLIIVVVLPGPGKTIGLLLLALALAIALIAVRRTLENVAAGFGVGRAIGARRGTRITCGGCDGMIEEWAATGLRVRADDGRIIHLPYRVCEESALILHDRPGDGDEA